MSADRTARTGGATLAGSPGRTAGTAATARAASTLRAARSTRALRPAQIGEQAAALDRL